MTREGNSPAQATHLRLGRPELVSSDGGEGLRGNVPRALAPRRLQGAQGLAVAPPQGRELLQPSVVLLAHPGGRQRESGGRASAALEWKPLLAQMKL